MRHDLITFGENMAKRLREKAERAVSHVDACDDEAFARAMAVHDALNYQADAFEKYARELKGERK